MMFFWVWESFFSKKNRCLHNPSPIFLSQHFLVENFFRRKLLLYIPSECVLYQPFLLKRKKVLSYLSVKTFLFSFFFFSPFSFEFFFLCLPIFFRKNRSVRMGDGLMQRMSRGRGQCQLNVHGQLAQQRHRTKQ